MRRGSAAVFAAFVVVGCDGELTENITDAPIASDAGATVPSVTATVHFDTDIQKDIDALSCSNTGCHGSSMGGFRLIRVAAGADLTENFEAFKRRSASSDKSLTLIKATGEGGHVGGTRFAKGDAVYARWLTWIQEGNPR